MVPHLCRLYSLKKNNMVPLGQGGGSEVCTPGTACIWPIGRTVYFSPSYVGVLVENVPHLCLLYCPIEEQSGASEVGRDGEVCTPGTACLLLRGGPTYLSLCYGSVFVGYVPHLYILCYPKEEQYGMSGIWKGSEVCTAGTACIWPRGRTIFLSLGYRKVYVENVPHLWHCLYITQKKDYLPLLGLKKSICRECTPPMPFILPPRKKNLVPQGQEGMMIYVTLLLLLYCLEASLPISPWARKGGMQGMYPTYAFYTTQRKNNMVPQGYEGMAKYVTQVPLLYCPVEGQLTLPVLRNGISRVCTQPMAYILQK